MKVFLVEDSAAIRERVRLAVAECGGTVIGEADGQQDAIRAIRQCCPQLVILDIVLAQGNGIEVLRHVKADLPAIRVIVLSNFSSQPYRKRCQELGAEYFLDKNQEFEMLGSLLVTATSGGA